jgi:hypothetical protein
MEFSISPEKNDKLPLLRCAWRNHQKGAGGVENTKKMSRPVGGERFPKLYEI